VLRRLLLWRRRANDDRTASTGKQNLAGLEVSKDSDGSKAHAVLGPIMSNISSDDVRAEVKKFWDFLSRKLKSQFAEMYLSSATVFAADARRMEPARLMLVRRERERELLGPASFVAAKLGSIDVQPLGADLAIASYPFHLSITRTLASGKRYQSEVPRGRATQVFHRDEKGVLRIIREHMSSAEPVSSKELPAMDPPQQV
jgi:ketosteroid isomerase-like protein